MSADDHHPAAVAPHLRSPERIYDGYIFDLDGTIYLGDELLPGAADTVARLRELGSKTVFVSNNPTRDPEMYAAKLVRLGIEAEASDIINPTITLRDWLLAEHPQAALFVIGEAPLCRVLETAGLRLTDDPEQIDIVVASYDRGFDYRKLQIAFDALWRHRRATLVTTNLDPYCPLPGGRGEPDAAAVVAAIEACTGVKCKMNVGKPSALMALTVLSRLDLAPGQCVMVGDRLSTDIAMGAGAGMDSVLVLTGDATLAAWSNAAPTDRPTWVVESVAALLPDGRRV